MTRYVVTLNTPAARERVSQIAAKAPLGVRVEFKSIKRSLPQNDKMWSMLTDISQQLVWHGRKLRPDDWKLMFLDGLNLEHEVVPNIDGTGFVTLGRSSSDLSKDEMSDLIELMSAFGASHGVVFGDEAKAA